jgi:hypothetical protein
MWPRSFDRFLIVARVPVTAFGIPLHSRHENERLRRSTVDSETLRVCRRVPGSNDVRL